MGKETLEQLQIAFCDEDTPTWTRAARELGKLAVDDPKAMSFIKYWLERSPAVETKSDELFDSEVNIHRFRHACCALASYLSQKKSKPKEDEQLWSIIEREVRTPLVGLCFDALAQHGKVEDLEQIEGLNAQFDVWRTTQIEQTKALVEKFAKGENKRALEAKQKQLEKLETLDPSTPIPKDFKPAKGKFYDHTPWALASFLAGATSERCLVGLPIDLAVEGLTMLAVARNNGGLPLVLNLPLFLNQIESELDKEMWQKLLGLLLKNRSDSWVTERLHYNDYIVELSSLTGAPDFMALWEGSLNLPEWLHESLGDWDRALKDGSKDTPRIAARIMRRVVDEFFKDDWRWQELDEDTRFSLNVFTLLITGGRKPVGAKGGKGKRSKKVKDLGIQHRIALLMDALAIAKKARDQVLPALVRCLKLLLDAELNESLGKPTLGDVCRRQIAIVQPLVAEWQLPGTMRKDLATIVCRVLMATYRADRAVFVELLYTVLFALPDEMLFRELIEYSTEPAVSDLVRDIVALIERWYRPRGDTDAGRVRGVNGYEPDVETWGIYVDYTARLAGIAEGTDEVDWVLHLPRLIAHLGRIPGTMREKMNLPQETTGRQVGQVLDATLLRVLQCKQQSIESWELQTPRKKSDRKGAQWAAMETQRRIENRTRAVYDQFQRLLDDIEILESDCLPEVGRPRPSDDLSRRWRRLISSLDELGRLCADELPYLEREMCTHLLKTRIDNLEIRLHSLMMVLEKEDEDVAIQMLEDRVARDEQELASGEHSEPQKEDSSLVQEWMLDRYMVKELAGTLKLRVLGVLTHPFFVALWILTPFILCSVFHKLKIYAWRGVPFAAFTLMNVVLLSLYFLDSRKNRTASAATGRFLLPQITAALFLGLTQLLSVDESWAVAVLEYPWVRIFTVVAFLLTGFFFTREVLLGDQLKSKADIKKKNRRAASVMSLVLWQSFCLVVLFGVLSGRLMGGRAEINPKYLVSFAKNYAEWLPYEVHLGKLFLQPVNSAELFPPKPAYRIFPWALMQWTVQVFFFSAVFERIMKGGSSDR